MYLMNALSLAHVSKSFSTITAVDDLSFSIPGGCFGTLLGPSGSGKSTVLRLIAGLDHPDAGQITIGHDDVTHQPPHRRPSAMVFQRYALFPHMTVRQNIGFGLKQQKIDQRESSKRVEEVLDLVQMSDRADAYPHQLSGGQEQRIALARALVVRPQILLLDEPLSALDAGLRKRMQTDLRQIQRQSGITFLSVTHDQDEALAMSDWIAVMNHGRIEQHGTPQEIFDHPASRFIAEFMGATNILPVSIRNRDARSITVTLSGSNLTIPRSTDSSEIALVIRPDAIRLASESEPDWNVELVSSSYRGTVHVATLRLADGTHLIAEIPTSLITAPTPGTHLRIAIDTQSVALVPDG